MRNRNHVLERKMADRFPELPSSDEALLGGFSYPFSLKFLGQLSLIPKIIETVIPKITYLWNYDI